MAGITLHSENNETVTCVPNVFIDELMADADGEYVKIYLYLLRRMNAPEESFSISGMADKFEIWDQARFDALLVEDVSDEVAACHLDIAL